MSNDIRIKRGLTLRLKGEAEKTLVDAPRSKTFAIKPPDFHAVIPKMILKEGADLQVGDEIFFSKYTPEVRFTSPVSGTLKEIKRGARRRIMELIIEADPQDSFRDFGKMDPLSGDAEAVKEKIYASGCGPFIKQRPYDIVADPKDSPKAIFVSAMNTAPLSGDVEFILKDRMQAFQVGLNALTRLTAGKVHVSIAKDAGSDFRNLQNVEIHQVSGPHPAANVGVQIHHIDPIDQGDRVWTVGPEDVANIGDLFLTGKFSPTRTVALAGSSAENRKYYRTVIGANVADLVGTVSNDIRIISGDVYTGDKISNGQYLGFYPNTLTLIPEGNNYRMFGWLPFTYSNVPSNSRTSLSWLFPNKEYEVNTNLNGEDRSLVVTGEMEEVFPMDIFPMQLLKACMAGDIEKMENLGIYEVAPEDFALIDYVNTSKLEAQEVIRLGLDLMITEVG